jgi:uncharacterized protein
MNIGFDIDGVIANFKQRFIEIIAEKYDVLLTDSDMYSYDPNLVLGVSKAEVGEVIVQTLSSDLPLYPEAKETLEKLTSQGHNIYLLTARHQSLIQVTSTWLKKNDIPYKEVFYLPQGRKSEAKIQLDLIVEDNLAEALELSNKIKHVLLFNQPWNKTKNVKDLIKRVNSWSEIYQEVERVTRLF